MSSNHMNRSRLQPSAPLSPKAITSWNPPRNSLPHISPGCTRITKVHVHDLHATVLRLLGFDHEKLTHRYNGRDFRLTDVAGKVVTPPLA